VGYDINYINMNINIYYLDNNNNDNIYGDHLAWPLVVGALLGSEERSPAPDTC
jgi:hypothetical protein